jgi:hypothetical protein
MLGAPSSCFTCGLPTAEMTPVYRMAVKIFYARLEKARDSAGGIKGGVKGGIKGGEKLPITEGTGPNGAPIIPQSLYEAMGLAECCRVRIAAAMDIRDYLPEEEIIPQ